jgi:hypothetical protein
MSKAYNYRFTHQVHHSVKGSVAANVLGERRQVSLPQLKEHRGAAFRDALVVTTTGLSGELGGNACARATAEI